MKTLLLLLFSFQFALAQDIDAQLKDSKKSEGFINYYWNEAKGKIYMEVKELNAEFIYYPSLARGLGSNDLGLDRGRLGGEHLVYWEKIGNKLLLVESNTAYRASSSDKLEKEAVEQSFAKSVLFGFEILKQSDGVFIIDFTPFMLRDAMEASKTITELKQGTYSFDATRSGVYQKMCKNFPLNTELEAIITLTGSNAGPFIESVAPSPEHLTMHQHHTFVKLPEPGYEAREFDPRMGYNGISFFDYSTPINSKIQKYFTSRHRLQKKDPNAILSEAVKPIIYYLDPGTPEPIRSALFEGATWWNQAFEAAGYKNAFQVQMLPADADPMDVRYNVVQWVHRSTRGWSYGMSINDPRTGEIIKGKVTLGSLRVRQDYLLAQGLAGDFSEGQSDSLLLKLSLDRLRQLSAHEIGHTLGLAHNYISSTQGRTSVMDYPHPLVFLDKNKNVDLSEAYTKGIGEYDKVAITWGYQDFPKNVDKTKALEDIVLKAIKKNLVFLTDQDARPDGSVHPQTHLWDNAEDPTQELDRLIQLRSVVLNKIDAKKLPTNAPLATLEEVLVPMYMFHRFQVQAASKVLGGAFYTYALKGDGQEPFRPVPDAIQRKTISVLLKTLDPEFLALPKQVLTLIPPRPFRYNPNPREVFKRKTGLAFDVLSPAESSAQLSLSLLLNAQRASRMATQQIFDKNLPPFSELLNKMTGQIIKNKEINKNNYLGQINRLVADMYVNELRILKTDPNANIEVKANVTAELETILKYLKEGNIYTEGFAKYLTNRLNLPDIDFKTLKNTYHIAPDGQPIDQDYDWLGCEEN